MIYKEELNHAKHSTNLPYHVYRHVDTFFFHRGNSGRLQAAALPGDWIGRRAPTKFKGSSQFFGDPKYKG